VLCGAITMRYQIRIAVPLTYEAEHNTLSEAISAVLVRSASEYKVKVTSVFVLSTREVSRSTVAKDCVTKDQIAEAERLAIERMLAHRKRK
jgi:ribosomal protein L20A (L18A)